jgi:hypothetical protein
MDTCNAMLFFVTVRRKRCFIRSADVIYRFLGTFGHCRFDRARQGRRPVLNPCLAPPLKCYVMSGLSPIISKVRLHAGSFDLQNLEENCLRFEGSGVVLHGAIVRLDRMDLVCLRKDRIRNPSCSELLFRRYCGEGKEPCPCALAAGEVPS